MSNRCMVWVIAGHVVELERVGAFTWRWRTETGWMVLLAGEA